MALTRLGESVALNCARNSGPALEPNPAGSSGGLTSQQKLEKFRTNGAVFRLSLRAGKRLRGVTVSDSVGPVDSAELTRLIRRVRLGHEQDRERLLQAVYSELKRLAQKFFRGEKAGHTLQPTALVNEAYLRMFAQQNVGWDDKAHFFGVAARQMRHVLVDHARARASQKRGGGRARIELDEHHLVAVNAYEEILALDACLEKLEKLDPQASKVFDLKYFGGFSDHEAAELAGISHAQLRRDWLFSRTWLRSQLL